MGRALLSLERPSLSLLPLQAPLVVPFEIIKTIGKVSYQLALPSKFAIKSQRFLHIFVPKGTS